MRRQELPFSRDLISVTFHQHDSLRDALPDTESRPIC